MLSNNLKIMQQNLKKSHTFTNQILKFADEKIGVISLQEPYAYKKDKERLHLITGIGPEYNVFYHKSTEFPKSAILIRRNMNALFDDVSSNANCTVVTLNSFVIISMYFNLVENDGLSRDIEADLDKLADIIKKYNNKKLIIMIDSNSRHTFWGDRLINDRGAKLCDFILGNNLVILNDRSSGPTFHSYGKFNNELILKNSFIDLSIISNNCNEYVFKWYKYESVCNSDHSTLVIDIESLNNPFRHLGCRKTLNLDRSD